MWNYRYLFEIFLLVVSTFRFESRIDQNECDRFLHRSDCYFYPCLDVRYRCGPWNHLVGFSYQFCQIPKEISAENWSKDATKFFDELRNCSMTMTKKKIVEPTISELFRCADLQEKLVEIHFDCLTKASIKFCSILCENLRSFLDFFLHLDEQQLNLVEFLRRTLSSCGTKTNETTISKIFLSNCDQNQETWKFWQFVVSRRKRQIKNKRDILSRCV